MSAHTHFRVVPLCTSVVIVLSLKVISQAPSQIGNPVNIDPAAGAGASAAPTGAAPAPAPAPATVRTDSVCGE